MEDAILETDTFKIVDQSSQKDSLESQNYS